MYLSHYLAQLLYELQMGNFWVMPLLHSVRDKFLKTQTDDNTECLLQGTNSNYTYYLDNFMLQDTRNRS